MLELRRLFSSTETRVLLVEPVDGPTCNVKDRVARAILDSAKNLGLVSGKTRIVEASSGAAGIALASAAIRDGLEITIVSPENIAPETKATLERLGVKLEITPANLGMNGAVDAVEKLLRSDRSYWSPKIFENQANPAIHEATTGYEILTRTHGRFDAFVCASGTGGTFTGVARRLRRYDPSIQRVVVEPAESAALSGKAPGKHGIIGIGPGFVPKIFDRSLPTGIIVVSTEEAVAWADKLAKEEGVLAGRSTGANLAAVAKLAKSGGLNGKTIVTVAFDRNKI